MVLQSLNFVLKKYTGRYFVTSGVRQFGLSFLNRCTIIANASKDFITKCFIKLFVQVLWLKKNYVESILTFFQLCYVNFLKFFILSITINFLVLKVIHYLLSPSLFFKGVGRDLNSNFHHIMYCSIHVIKSIKWNKYCTPADNMVYFVELVDCEDSWSVCSLVPVHGLCNHHYYGRQCCKSCQTHTTQHTESTKN